MKCTAIINENSPRAVEWQKVFEKHEVEIMGFLPQRANVLGTIREVYWLDLKKLDQYQFKRLAEHISEKFGAPFEFVIENLHEEGVPILAEDLIVTCDNPFFL